MFTGVESIQVHAHLEGTRASIEVRTQRGRAKRECTVRVDRDSSKGTVRAQGEASLSLAELHTGEPQVPLGAVKLEDTVIVRFDVALHEAN